tara:strand:+ start:1769 stop:2005 length:237 start_codon:yes stop_codon:yes gene_type:complete
MNKYKSFFLLLIFVIASSCNKDETGSIENPIEMGNTSFGVDNNYILKNNLPFQIKGVVYVPGYPGFCHGKLKTQHHCP